MVTNKRGQGLPLNVIVLAAIAALVLVLVIAFTIFGLGGTFSRIFGAVGVVGEEIDTVRTNCDGFCSRAQTITRTTAWETSSYCTKTFNIDLNEDGELKAEDNEIGLHCWDGDIGVTCTVSLDTATCSSPASGETCSIADCGVPAAEGEAEGE